MLKSKNVVSYLAHTFLLMRQRRALSPVRKCHSPPKQGDATTPKPPASQSYLYKAVTKSLFLRRTETVFDPDSDVTKYQGYTLPLCNLVVRDATPLFVHPEFIYDTTLQNTLPLGPGGKPLSARTTARGKPARRKVADEDEAFLGH